MTFPKRGLCGLSRIVRIALLSIGLSISIYVASAQTTRGYIQTGMVGGNSESLVLQQSEPDLSVTKGTSGNPVAGQVFEYFISYNNSGSISAPSVVLVDTLPANTTYVSDDSGLTPTVVGGTVAWNLGTLAAGASGGFSLRLLISSAVPVGTSLSNNVTISTTATEINLGNNSFTHTATTVVASPDLFVLKGASGEAVSGQTLEYFISYSNNGSGSATSVVLTDTLPANTTYVSDDSGIIPNISSGRVIWNLGTLAAGASGGFSMRVLVASTVPVGTNLSNNVQIASVNQENVYSNNSFTHQITVTDDDGQGPSIDTPTFASDIASNRSVLVSVLISDAPTGNHGVSSAILYYGYAVPYNQYSVIGTSPGGTGNGVWTFAIPAQGSTKENLVLRFWVSATDNDNSLAVSSNNNSGSYYGILINPAVSQTDFTFLPLIMRGQ